MNKFDVKKCFIPKDNYISRIVDNLKKEQIAKAFKKQCEYFGINPKELRLIISKDVNSKDVNLAIKAYEELVNSNTK